MYVCIYMYLFLWNFILLDILVCNKLKFDKNKLRNG
jgi:hypothetical protein